MDFLKYIIMPVAELIGNFGWTVVLSVAVCFAITIPFKHMAAKSKEAKKPIVKTNLAKTIYILLTP